MDSFYGGKPGSPFIIKATFETVGAMREAFMKGQQYQDVWYGEYCIINAVSNNSYDNGKIFRRTFNYGDPEACAEYVCKITGPEGGVPDFRIEPISVIKELITKNLEMPRSEATLNEINRQLAEEGKELISDGEYEPDTRSYPTSSGVHVDYTNGEEQPDIVCVEMTTGTGDLIPGYYLDSDGNPQFNDNIEYTWCVEKFSPYNPENGGQSISHFGFKVPYLVPRFNEDENSLVKIDLQDGTTNPFSPLYSMDVAVPTDFNIDSSGNLKFKYDFVENLGVGTEVNAGVIPSILKTYVDENYILWILYSAPVNDASNIINKNNIEGYWKECGYIKDYDGILIEQHVDIIDGNNTPAQLKQLLGSGKDGRVVTVNTPNSDKKTFYAFDYVKEEWYSLGTFDDSGSGIEFLAHDATAQNNRSYLVTSPATDFQSFHNPTTSVKHIDSWW